MNTPARTLTGFGLGALTVIGVMTGGTLAASAATPPAAETSGSTSSDLATMLTYMREEERLARDLYAAIAEYYDGTTPFSKITTSEDRHYDAVGTLLDTYDIDDPSDGLAPGTYAIAELQTLYDTLLADAQASLDAAYDVGITVEETDISDLEAALAADYPADVDRVLSNLLRGSEKHLAAFTSAADGTSASHPGGSGADRGRNQGHGPQSHTEPSRATADRQGRQH